MSAPDETILDLPVGKPVRKHTALKVTGASVASLVVLAILLRAFGLLIPYKIPTDAMDPAVAKNEAIVMEGFTYLFRKPARGDIIVFETAGIEGIPVPPSGEQPIYNKRIVGVPGDHLRLERDGRLLIDEKPVSFRNKTGEIRYTILNGSHFLASDLETFTVPEGCYFVLGDNSPKSSDSRFWGCVPAGNIKGRIAFHQ